MSIKRIIAFVAMQALIIAGSAGACWFFLQKSQVSGGFTPAEIEQIKFGIAEEFYRSIDRTSIHELSLVQTEPYKLAGTLRGVRRSGAARFEDFTMSCSAHKDATSAYGWVYHCD